MRPVGGIYSSFSTYIKSGESLLNDGSAIVFFSIFSGLFLLELGVEGLGEQVNGLEGIKLFFRKSVGGACIGLFFGLGLLTLLYLLNRRLDREENVVQVGSTITLAYLCYFTAEVAWETSGVMAVVAMGVRATIKYYVVWCRVFDARVVCG